MAAAKSPSPRERMPAAERREEILAAAVELFQRRGYDATSLREIAEEVGIRKASLYHHFPTKESILSAIHGRFMDTLIERAERRRGSDEPPLELIAAYMRDLVEMIRDRRAYVDVFFRERNALGEEAWAEVRERRRRFESAVEDAVRRGIESGEVRSDLDPRVISYGLFGLCNWMHQWFDPAGRLSAEQIADQLVALALGGLRPR